MADAAIPRVALLLVALLWLGVTTAACAQDQLPTPAPTAQNASPGAEAKREASQPLNNAPVWRDVRSGVPGVTQVRGRETNILIQPQGEAWRSLRAPLAFWGGILVALAILGLAAFYLIRGPLDLAANEKRGGRLIERFTPMDRYAHWLLAITWATLAITGLILSLGKSVLLPVIGYTLFSWLAIVSKTLHNFVGPILIVAVPLLFVRFVRDNGIGVEDIKWFLNIWGYFTGQEYPSGKFNAGEKLVFWVVLVILSTVLVGSGLVLVFPNFDQTRSTMQIANVVHMVAAYVAISLALVHAYLGTIGMIDAYRAMRYGYVDESWAKHHHLRWYQEVTAGRAREHFADPKAVAAAGTPPPRTRPA
ncbi:MAG TPA: formate dehydrogenase subunit gamma [Casimicrobiaceae bacterium]|jgi:formate dehydrogenase subunit gamma|nr:formate dehydrogenase subunit gamma [Casimicrobiaceae bacterium]